MKLAPKIRAFLNESMKLPNSSALTLKSLKRTSNSFEKISLIKSRFLRHSKTPAKANGGGLWSIWTE